MENSTSKTSATNGKDIRRVSTQAEARLVSYRAVLIGRLALCDGYDELTRLEYLAELRELMEAAA